ncbi:hypothetical protein [Actinoplanes sp. N902-109]|uniref:hypothetical protein n=1 Tax=Actinoplanes sp. (strain N902-109) TaxID=649831 RepID=UPI0012FB233B|nr:hypothetical protein [Actinoplanes sp. N902-109]
MSRTARPSADDATDIVTGEYELGDHSGDNLPPTVAMVRIRPDAPDKMARLVASRAPVRCRVRSDGR